MRSTQTIKKTHSDAKHLYAFLLVVLSFFTATLPAAVHAETAEKLHFTQDEQLWLKTHPEVSIVSFSDLPPSLILTKDGTYTGFLADVAKLFSKQTGINFKIETRPSWREVRSSADNRETDIIGIAATPDSSYNALYHYTLPYTHTNFLIFGPTYTHIPSNKMEGLKNQRVGYIASYKVIENFTKKHPKINFTSYQSAYDLINALEHGEIDFIIHSDWFEYQLRIKEKSNIKAHLQVPGLETDAFMLVRNDWPELTTIINKVLSANQDKAKEITAHWLEFTKSIDVSAGTLRLTEEEQIWIAKHPIVRVGIDPSWAPIEFIGDDGIIKGISVQYLQRLQEIVGIKFKLIKGSSWSDTYDKLTRSELDLLPAVSATKQRWEKVNFTAPYLSIPIGIFSATDQAYLGGLSSLKGKSVIVVKGHAIQTWLEKEHPELELQTAPTLKEALKEVANGDIYAFVGNLVSTSYYIGQSGLAQIKVVGETKYGNDLSMAVRKDWLPLLGILQKGLNIISEKERDAIYNEWISIQYKHSIDYALLWQVVGAALLSLLITVYWIRCLAKEISQHRLTETSLRKSKKKAEQATLEAQYATQAKSEFLANMSHEIRTPMNAVISANHLLQQTELTVLQYEYLKKMTDSSKVLLTTIDDILGFSAGEAGKLKLDSINFNINTTLNKIMQMFELQAAKKKLKLNINIDPLIPEILAGDVGKLSQILRNLTANAIKFTRQGTIEVKAHLVEHNIKNGKAQLCFMVKDTGPGMSLDLQRKLFQPFSQGDPSVTRKYGGTGLGLAISQQLAQVMESHICIRSELGKGSRFSFVATFDVCALQTPVKPDPHKINGITRNPALEGKRVLLVEDDELNQFFEKKFLSALGIKVEIAENGLKALESLKKSSFDIILMDIQMPELDGYETTKAIRRFKQWEQLPIIALTAHALSDEREKCREAGMNDYLTKPFDPEQLRDMLLKWVIYQDLPVH